MTDSKLTDSKLTDSKLTDSKLTDSKLTDSKLTDSKMTDSKMTDSKMDESIEVIPSHEKMNSVDTASLTFFTNPHYLNILQRKKLCDIKDNADEVKFYRKRIVSLFKDMLKESEGTINREIKELHTMFVNATIRYFEITDKKDIIQDQHMQGQHMQGQHMHDDDDDVVPAEELSPEDILNAIDGSEINSISEANDLMMRKTITLANLDNYVITKQDISANEIRIIPMKMEIDLKTHDLKIKGVPKKSKKKKEDLSN